MLDMIFSWNTLFWLLLALYLPACLALIGVVLLQKGKGVGFQGAFGAGTGAETVFGPRTSRSLPQRITYTMAGLFMVLALCLSLLSGRVGRGAAPELLDETAAATTKTEPSSEQLNELFEEGTAPADGAAAPADGAAATSTPVTVTPSVDENMVTIPAAPDGGAAAVSPADGAAPEASPAPEAVPVETPVSIPLDAGTPTESVVPPPVSLGGEAPSAAIPSETAPVAEEPAAEAPAEEAPAAE